MAWIWYRRENNSKTHAAPLSLYFDVIRWSVLDLVNSFLVRFICSQGTYIQAMKLTCRFSKCSAFEAMGSVSYTIDHRNLKLKALKKTKSIMLGSLNLRVRGYHRKVLCQWLVSWFMMLIHSTDYAHWPLTHSTFKHYIFTFYYYVTIAPFYFVLFLLEFY